MLAEEKPNDCVLKKIGALDNEGGAVGERGREKRRGEGERGRGRQGASCVSLV